jgi:DNA-directed RNA polymerase specialized sigma24 family protein
MQIESPSVQVRVKQVVWKLNREDWLFDELFHEGLYCFFINETDFPGNALSWYLQRCRFHLLDYLGRGRSLDALKRRHSAELLPDEHADNARHIASPDCTVLETVHVLGIVAGLSAQLKPEEKAVLICLQEGYTLEEIAAKLGRCSSAIFKLVKKIRKAALRMNLFPEIRERTEEIQIEIAAVPVRAGDKSGSETASVGI